MFGGEEPEWPGMALMLGFSKEDATTFVFQETGKTKGGAVVGKLREVPLSHRFTPESFLEVPSTYTYIYIYIYT